VYLYVYVCVCVSSSEMNEGRLLMWFFSFFGWQIGSQEFTRNALEAESQGHYQQAFKIYSSAIASESSDVSPSERDFWDSSLSSSVCLCLRLCVCVSVWRVYSAPCSICCRLCL
jgi:hypothetical protein